MANIGAMALSAGGRAVRRGSRKRLTETRFFRSYGIFTVALLVLIAWTAIVWAIAAHSTTVKVTKALTAEYDETYELKMQEFREEVIALNTPSEDEVQARQMRKEADAIAKVIGTMKTKRMKQTMIWNILVRVDSPYYPDTVAEVCSQPSQWMFYSDTNPIRDDDVALAMEQLKLWHEGRYPAALQGDMVYGEWSENDYVMRNTWDKSYKTVYWRYPE